MRFLRLIFIFASLSILLLSACRKSEVRATTISSTSKPQPTADELAAMETRVKQLEREIESSTQIIDDLEAAVDMERTKLEDDPNYDQSFLNEIFADQNRERADINKARAELKALQKKYIQK